MSNGFGLIPCGDIEAPTPCGQPPEPSICGGISVCGREFLTVEQAWKETGIPPHKLRFYAKTPSFMGVFYL